MRSSKFLVLLLLLTGGAGLAGASSAGAQGAGVRDQQKAGEEKSVAPLIRMDLLRLAPAPAGPPKRNIFAPRIGPSRPSEPSPPPAMGLPPVNPGAAGVAPADPAAAQPAAAPVFTIDLRYIGFVDSLKTGKIIGLVIFQGQAQAVVEGDVISEGVRIGKIGRQEIQVILPDSTTRTFSLEGEE